MAPERAHYHDRITQDPAVMVGKPVVRDTRIPVELVLGHLAANPHLDDLFGASPHLTIDDVKACLAYAEAAGGRKHRATGKEVLERWRKHPRESRPPPTVS